MDKVTLGRTGLEVSRLSMGGLFIMSGHADLDTAKATVKNAVDAGINYIDTAPGYGNSEEVLGQCLEGLDKPVVLSTKLGGRPKPFEPQNKEALRSSVEESLKLLKIDCIDILMIHEPDRPGQYDWWTDMVDVEGPVLELMDELKREGKIKYTGLGGTTAWELAHLVRSGKFDVVLTAFNYSLLWREAELSVIPAAKEQNVGVVAGSPLQQGSLSERHDVDNPSMYWLSEPRREQFKKLYALCDELGMEVPELAMRFVFSNPDVHAVLTGVKSEDELRKNLAALEAGPLPADVMAKIDTISAMVPFRPCEEPGGLGWRLRNPDGYKGPGGL